MKPIAKLMPFAVMLCLSAPAPAAEEKKQMEVQQVYEEVQKLITEYYPQAKFDTSNGNFIARFNTRKFMIHHALKTGEWQDAHEQEGPNRRGIQCSISSAAGPWAGAAMVPQTFDYRYYSSLLMAPYNKRLNTHLTAHLDYPGDTSAEFTKRYSQIISSFANK